jgi:hypothetical protein
MTMTKTTKPALTAESIPTGHPSMPQQLIDALAVMVLTPHIRAYLAKRDPKALEQAESALEWVKVAAVLLPMGYDEAHAVLRALCEAHGAAFTPEADRTKLEWVAGRLLGPVNAATLKRARQEQELLTQGESTK